MSIRSELSRIIAGKPKQPADPVTKGGTSTEDKNPYARIGVGGKGGRRQSIQRFMKAYKRGGPYADMVDAYHLFTLAPGYEFKCEVKDQGLKDQVVAWCDQEHVDLDFIMQQGILSAKLAGDSYQEIVPTQDGKDIWGVITRDPSMFEKVVDKYDVVQGYIQYTQENLVERPTEIEKTRILNLMIDCIPGSTYGQSVWDRAEDNINQDCDIIESATKAMHRHGTPKTAWQLGSEENRASDTDIKTFRKEVEEMNAKTDFVVTHDTKPVAMDTEGINNVDVYSNVSLQRTACALGVPEEMAGLGRGSTEATATVRMDSFLKRITAIQQVVARTYSRGLIDRITGQPGRVWIEFNSVSPEDWVKVAEGIAKLRSGIDPDAVIDANESREKVGLPPRKEEPATEPQESLD
jgi:hypothetical protein